MNQLIIFIKNPVKGKVKTRLAASIGDNKALEIYLKLIGFTLRIAADTKAKTHLFFSDHLIDNYDGDTKNIQQGNNLGERMKNAFHSVIEGEETKTLIIGTDCAELHSEIIQLAFEQLETHDLVIGPAQDGGYYLLGMKKYFPEIFNDIEWSTSEVFNKTLLIAKNNSKSVFLLPVLRDIDTEDDLFTLSKTEL
jgi:rSAM/selenodomain-associated transferase 1